MASTATSSSSSSSKAPKKDDIAVGNLLIVYQDSSRELQECIVGIATNALKSFYKGEKNQFCEIAEQIKCELEDAQQGAWHVIVGKSFGSFVTHEVKKMMYFFLGQIGFLVFRHG